MRENRIVRVLKIALLVVVGVAVFSLVVMSLWNWLTPALFGWHRISFWQALGLLVLSKILFGGFRGRPGMHWRRRMMERWEQMTPEEREKFRQGLEVRWGGCRPPAAQPKSWGKLDRRRGMGMEIEGRHSTSSSCKAGCRREVRTLKEVYRSK